MRRRLDIPIRILITVLLLIIGIAANAVISDFWESRPISWREAKNYVGQVKTVCGVIVFQASSSDMSPMPNALLIFGDAGEPKGSYQARVKTPNGVSVYVSGEAVAKFPALESYYNQPLCVKGQIETDANSAPHIGLSDIQQVTRPPFSDQSSSSTNTPFQ